ncbi:proprotein convertase subtilisin/kexin type 5-like [Ruditapes philippinarum]|uniref:proprotein convertase subtilisin/kexin type 5-like n=1 Tax=Ruditapes philippinarum TaxID=129788 RepID=UPI00295BA95F|nr:proprotein convertase subtilisin/kexin type 5-like [Ruditapes philippinarum]
MTCLSTCPSGYKYLNATCVQGCPHDFPFSYDYTAKAKYGLNNIFTRIKIEPTCTRSCPDNLYQVNHTCQPFCPDGLYTVDKTCEAACPKLKEFKRHRSISFEKYDVVSDTWNYSWKRETKQAEIVECVTACSHNESIFNSTCIETCPIYTMSVNKSCLSECPEYFLFIIQRTKGVKCSASQKCEGVYRYSECLRECPPGSYQFNSTCVDACPDSTFTVGNSCAASCPEYQRFLLKSERTVTQWRQGWDKKWSKISRRLNAGYLCLEFCPSDKKVHNLTCMDHCPKKSFVNGNECVYECPPESPLEYTDNETWACIRSCDDEYKTFYYNGSCHYSCTAPLIEYDGFCLEKCPPGFLWFNECTRRIDVVIISALILGISIIILAFGRNVVKEYGIVLCESMSYYLTCKTKDKYTIKDRYGKSRNDCQMPETIEIQRCDGIEMDQITNSNSNLIDFEQPLHEETNV